MVKYQGTLFFTATNNEILYFFNEEVSILNVNIAPNFSIFVSDKFLIGSELIYTRQEERWDKSKHFAGTFFGRYYPKVSPIYAVFIEIGGGFSRQLGEMFSPKLAIFYGGIGIDWFFSKTVALELLTDFRRERVKEWIHRGINGGDLILNTYHREKINVSIGFKFFIRKK